MGKGVDFGLGGVSRLAKNGYFGVAGVARSFIGSKTVKDIPITVSSATSNSTVSYINGDGEYVSISLLDLTAIPNAVVPGIFIFNAYNYFPSVSSDDIQKISFSSIGYNYYVGFIGENVTNITYSQF